MKAKIPYIRWWIVGLLFVASMLNYVDRQVLSQLKTTIQSHLNFDDIEYGNIVNAFLIAYGIAYLVSGRLTDWLGTRASMVLFISWWSISNILHCFAKSAMSLGFFRVLLGLGEAGNYTVGPKVVADWFPAKERALAIGVYTLGAAVRRPGESQAIAWRFGRTTLYVRGSAHGRGVFVQPFQCRIAAENIPVAASVSRP